jgi:outer membrane protein insertion porin family
MPYESWAISLGFSSGYAFHTPLGDLGFGGGINFGIGMKTYDADKYRPYLADMRDNNGNWRLGNKLIARSYLNDLDFWYNPGRGYYASQRFTWAGLLPLEYQQYVKSDSKIEAYLTLFNLPVFEGFNFKWIIGAHSGFQALMPKPGTPLLVSDDWLYIDGTFNARGWHNLYGMEGLTLWDNWLELRMPIFEQFLWLDGFLDAAAVRTSVGMVNMAGIATPGTPQEDPTHPDFSSLVWEDMAFSMGFGFRFTIPQFPFRFYFAKRFTYNGSDITWQTAPGSFDFVISITQPLF